ncbi:uncharacterized protein [Rutidosis leptorrhynchoides]|uniref:uncharacterized protein n=1 Tax=Rutidosis leptorrhynchoides TaxID=125765 RepID=UPI003A9999C9
MDVSGVYTTKSMANLIDCIKLETHSSYPKTTRNKGLPQKVDISVWRALLRRLPTRSELDKHEIDLDTILCPLCNTNVESVEHILINCQEAAKIWELLAKWWNANIA